MTRITTIRCDACGLDIQHLTARPPAGWRVEYTESAVWDVCPSCSGYQDTRKAWQSARDAVDALLGARDDLTDRGVAEQASLMGYPTSGETVRRRRLALGIPSYYQRRRDKGLTA